MIAALGRAGVAVIIAVTASSLLAGCNPSGRADTGLPATSASTASGSTSPKPSIVYDGTKTGFYKAWAQCLRDSGMDVEYAYENGQYTIKSRMPPDQDDSYVAASEACLDRLGRPWDVPLSQERMQQLYDEALALRECLLAAGYSVTDPPSYGTYSDQLRSSDKPPWDPRAQIPDTDINGSYAACPELDTF